MNEPDVNKGNSLIEVIRSWELPKGSDLALWWIGAIALAAALHPINPESKDIVLALGSGLTGFLTGYRAGQMKGN